MKRTTLIAIVIGAVILGGIVLVAQNFMKPPAPSGNATTTPVPEMPATADMLEKFDMMKQKLGEAGYSFAGGAMQVIAGDETAMVFLYKPEGENDLTDMLVTGFTTVYSVFDTKDPLLVGIVNTSEKISPTQYKMDVYALERSPIESYLSGGATKSELTGKAMLVTPNTTSLRSGNQTDTSVNKLSVNTNATQAGRTRNFTAPPDRRTYFTESLNRSGCEMPQSLAAGELPSGENVVSVIIPMPNKTMPREKYDLIEDVLKACIGAYGDHDRYMITFVPSSGNDYYFIDASADPVLDYFNGDISEWQLFNAINTTYYTK